MAPLKSAIAVLALVMARPVHADSIAGWRPYVAEASARFGLPIAWIERVMRAESGGRTSLNGRPITSRAGAMGLMQLMPGTWAAMRARLRLGTDPHDPRDNILAGTLYLRLMYDRFGYPGMFAAYNAGPGRYANHLATGRPLPGETRAYLAAVTKGTAPSPISSVMPVSVRTPTPEPAAPKLFFPLSSDAPKSVTDELFVTLPPAEETSTSPPQ